MAGVDSGPGNGNGEEKKDLQHEQTRPGGGNWGRHGDEEDGRRSSYPSTKGGSDRNRYWGDLDDEDVD